MRSRLLPRGACRLAILAGVVTGMSAMPEGVLAQAAVTDEVEQLLMLHHAQRTAHVLADPELLVASLADPLTEVAGGAIRTPARAELLERFGGYFEATRFLEWEDTRPPRIDTSPGGEWAEVLVEKRVRTVPADSADGAAGAWRYAWSERWELRDGVWRLVTITSTDAPDRLDLDDSAEASGGAAEADVPAETGVAPAWAANEARVRAYDILARARRSLGGEAAVAHVATLHFDAACEGPGGPFRTRVASARDGRAAFVQEHPGRPTFGVGRSLAGAWLAGEGRVDSLDAVLKSIVDGHELHLLALAPEARYTDPRARPAQELDGRPVDVVAFRDGFGADIEFLYERETGRPAGFRPVNHTGQGPPDILTRFADWRDVGGVQLPFDIRIEHGEDRYDYRIQSASVEWLPDAAFTEAGSIPRPAGR